MEKPTKIAIADVLQMREDADQEPAPECVEVSRQRAITMMAGTLVAMHDRGHTWPAIVKWLGERGLRVTSTTLHKVLRQAARKHDTGLDSPPEPSPPQMAAPAATKTPRKGPPGSLRVERPTSAKSPPAGARDPAPRSSVSAVPSLTPTTLRDTSTDAASQPAAVPKGTFVMRPDTPNL